MISEATMPIGTSRFGRLASSACVETESNPMYAKKMMGAPARLPGGAAPAQARRAEDPQPAPAEGSERVPVRRVDEERAHRDHEQHRGQLDADHGGVEAGALLD